MAGMKMVSPPGSSITTKAVNHTVTHIDGTKAAPSQSSPDGSRGISAITTLHGMPKANQNPPKSKESSNARSANRAPLARPASPAQVSSSKNNVFNSDSLGFISCLVWLVTQQVGCIFFLPNWSPIHFQRTSGECSHRLHRV